MTESKYIPKVQLQSLYKEHLENENLGTQVHINHEDCPEGEDRKKRLYLKKMPGMMLAYCHHCGSKGYLSTAQELLNASALSEDKSILQDSLAGYGLSTEWWWESLNALADIGKVLTINDWENWPIEAKLWLGQYELSKDDLSDIYPMCFIHENCGLIRLALPSCSHNHIYLRNIPALGTYVAAPEDNSLVKALCIYAPSGDIEHLVRKVHKDNPAMLSAAVNAYMRAYYRVSGGKNDHALILTEDPISAIKVSKKIECAAIPLLGTHLSDRVKVSVSNHTSLSSENKVYGWFDPDWAGKQCSLLCIKELSATTIISTSVQPKEYPASAMDNLLDFYSARIIR